MLAEKLSTLVNGKAPNPLAVNAETGQPWSGKLVAYPDMDINSPTFGQDLSGNGHDFSTIGTLTAFNSYPPVDTAPPDYESGLVGHWKFDESGNTNVAVDSSGGGNDGTLTNFPADESANWVAGKVGNALDFDGADDYVQITGLLGSPQNASLAAWVNFDSVDAGGNEVISIGDHIVLRVDYSSGGTGAFYYDGSSWLHTDTSIFHAGTGWRHVAYTFDDSANVQKTYIDGVERASSNHTGSISYAGLGANTLIGKHGNGGTDWDFNGLIDDVRVYNRALSANDVEALYHGGLDCLNPGGREGDVMFNDDERRMQYCNGESWVAMGKKPGSGDVTSGIVGWWKLDGNTSDSSGNGNDGTLQGGPVWSAGKVGGALEFDGVDDAVIRADAALDGAFPSKSSGGTNSFKVAAWVNFDDTSVRRPIVSKQQVTPTIRGWTLMTNAGGGPLVLEVAKDNSNKSSVGGTTVPVAGNWYHVVGTYEFVADGTSKTRMYVNGNLEGSGDAAVGPPNQNAVDFQIGSYQDGWFFDGLIDDVRVYERVLSAAEIAAIYNATASNYTGGLVGHWKLDDGTGSGTAADSSGNGNDGTLTNMDADADWIEGKLGWALDFDGTDDAVNVGNGAPFDNLLGTYTVCAWIHPRSAGEGNNGRITTQAPSGQAGGMQLMMDSDTTVALREHDGSADFESIISGITLNAWQHVCGRYDDNGSRTPELFLNGVEGSYTKQESLIGPLKDWTHMPVYIGGNTDGTRTFDGLIDDVRIYNRALSAAEVQALYNDTKGCANPDGRRASVIYNADYKLYQYCDGKNWMKMQ